MTIKGITGLIVGAVIVDLGGCLIAYIAYNASEMTNNEILSALGIAILSFGLGIGIIGAIAGWFKKKT